jgi:chaperone required for assembly of F1-ATPase
MKVRFGIELKSFESLVDEQDPSAEKAGPFFESLDPWALSCLNQMASACKSAAIAMSVISGELSLQDAVAAARVDEDFQVRHFGLVEGAHDLDEAVLSA